MILLIIALFVFLFFVAFNLVQGKRLRIALSLISVFGMVVSLGGLTLNFTNNLGMEKKDVTQSETIYSASTSAELPLLIYKNIGTSPNEKTYIYKESASDKDTKNTPIPGQDGLNLQVEVTNRVNQVNTQTAILKVTRTEVRYRTNFWKLLFGIAKNDQSISQEAVTLDIPTSWYVLSTDEVQKLQATLSDPSYQEELEEKATSYIADMIKKEMANLQEKAAKGDTEAAAELADPDKQNKLLQTWTKKYQSNYQREAMADLIDSVKSEK